MMTMLPIRKETFITHHRVLLGIMISTSRNFIMSINPLHALNKHLCHLLCKYDRHEGLLE